MSSEQHLRISLKFLLHSAGYRHATHQRRVEIFVAAALVPSLQVAALQAKRRESVCECGQYYCMDSKKHLNDFNRSTQMLRCAPFYNTMNSLSGLLNLLILN
jgi:hypothetical protein